MPTLAVPATNAGSVANDAGCVTADPSTFHAVVLAVFPGWTVQVPDWVAASVPDVTVTACPPEYCCWAMVLPIHPPTSITTKNAHFCFVVILISLTKKCNYHLLSVYCR